MPRRRGNANTNDPVQIKEYNSRDKYKTLKYDRNPALTKMYKEWRIKLDSFTINPINVSEYMEQVVELNTFINEGHKSAWANEIYNLHLPSDVAVNINRLKYEDIRQGIHLGRGDDSTGERILLSTEKAYLSQILNIRKVLSDDNEVPDDNMYMDWLVRREREIIPALIKTSIQNKWTLATFDGYLKAIRHFLKLILGENHELRIKYTMLYSDLDNIVQFVKGENMSTGDDVIEMRELLAIVDILETRFKQYFDADEKLKPKLKMNEAFKAHMDFLCVAVMVWDYPSRSDKYETEIVNDRSKATEKTTYLVDEEDRELYWIYRKDVKDIGRPYVVVPLEKKGLSGYQGRLIKAIRQSLRIFPREHLFINKTYNWNKNTGEQTKSKASNVSTWALKVNEIKEVLAKYPKIKQKSLGINVFRRSFVTYWIDIMSNNDKRKMIHAMLTSFSKIDTYYKRRFNSVELKTQVKLEYEAPEGHEAGKVKDLTNVVDSDDENEVIKPKPKPKRKKVAAAPPPPPDPPPASSEPKKPMSTAERQRKYYANNKSKEKQKDKQRDKLPSRKAQRIVRELNEGIKSFSGMKPATIQKYKISKKNGTYVFEVQD